MTAEERRARECKHPFVWPNGDCVQCGVLATTMPGHTEPTHIMVPRYLAPLLERRYEAGRSSMQSEAAQVADERKGKLKAIRSDLAPELEATRTYVETAEGVLESIAAAIRALKP